MSARKHCKTLGWVGPAWAMLLLWPAVAPAQEPVAGCATCGAGYSCQHTHCPPGLKHCMEAPPHICFQRGCPRPVCNPCMNPNWGYFEPCWNPWPWPPDFSHCRATPPAATVGLTPFPPVTFGAPQAAPTAPETTLPPPRPLRSGL